ncbi:hypothetical protein [Spirosoma flavum]|uniref:Uncharacterized protein n=1 Tax=Spirosoma flavum TaxID=2048557 RepID=A0ABW6AIF1_9BACT
MTQNQDTVLWQRPYTIKGTLSAFAPVLQAGNNQLYLFWVDPKGHIQYMKSTSPTGLEQATQEDFFTRPNGIVHPNDLVRLNWQLTEAGQEAVFICNDFRTENANPLVDGFILLANTIKKNKSIRELALMGSRYLPGKMMEWIAETTITKENKPNILYVDVAGTWIMEFCVALKQEMIYQK